MNKHEIKAEEYYGGYHTMYICTRCNKGSRSKPASDGLCPKCVEEVAKENAEELLKLDGIVVIEDIDNISNIVSRSDLLDAFHQRVIQERITNGSDKISIHVDDMGSI